MTFRLNYGLEPDAGLAITPDTKDGPEFTKSNNTGYKGRAGIYEIIQITTQLHAPIVHGPDIAGIRAITQKQGMPTMFQDGLRKAFNGVTTLEEVLRVTDG
jgi:type II secretory ATPase GspE/PulE/Tfp pilus assembly ATPase PilB-like protein